MPSSLLLAVLAALLAAAPAHARPVTLWGCHGPAGEPLPLGAQESATAEAAIAPVGGGCAAPAGALRIAFTRPDPLAGQWAALRIPAPAGLEHVRIGRVVGGAGYWARTASAELDAPPAAGDEFGAPAAGPWVEVGLRCEQEPCAGVVDVRFAALTVRDDVPPTFTVGRPTVATGTLQLEVHASDAGLGLARATATLAGATASRALGARCAELSPADATTDLPLAEDCPAADRVVLALDTTRAGDGRHPLAVTVTDAAGHAVTQTWEVQVVNEPTGSVRVPVAPSPQGVAIAPEPRPIVLAPRLRAGARYRISRAGTITVAASCPRAATVPCALALTLKAKLPGRRRASTIATGRGSAAPGGTRNVRLRLSRAALRGARTLRARLVLKGAAPARVMLVRSAR